MFKIASSHLTLGLTSLVGGLLLTNTILVTEAMAQSARPTEAMTQINSVSQLSDVTPTDWAFQAVQSLVERYGCIAGYLDKTYRGNRALSRYEFAAGLNACINRINELIAESTIDLVKKEDLETLKKLQEEFAAELATLRGRVDTLEAQTATLQAQEFSTTAKLVGEVVFAITDEFNQSVNNNTVFQQRVRLDIQNSFTGKDILHIRLAAGNTNIFNLKGNGVEGIQTFNFGNTNNSIYVDWMSYFFPIGENIEGYVAAVGGVHYDFVPTVSSYLEGYDSGVGSLSIFGQHNPIYLIGGGSGAGFTYSLSKKLSLSAGYLADNSDLFNDNYAALAQLTFSPSDQFSIGLTYINAYRKSAIFDTGSNLASVGTNLANGGGFDFGTVPSKVNAYGAEFTYKVSSEFAINGWFSYINADFVNLGTGDIWTYALTFAFPDLGKKNNLGGIVVGVEPYLGNASKFASGAKNDIPIHIEGFYKYQLNSNISITPGLIWVLSPGQNSENRDAIIGTLRTTFVF